MVRFSSSWSRLLVIGLMMSTSACSFAPKITEPETVSTLPEAFEEAPAPTVVNATRWWTSYNDAVLNQLVDTVLVRNYDLKVAAARVRELQNLYRINRAPLFPSVQLTVDGSKTSSPANTGATRDIAANIPDFPDRFENENYSASLGLSYELDFWGKLRNAKDAALSDYLATSADLETTRLGILSETVSTYFEILDLERQLALTQQSVDILQERTDLTGDRYERGLVTSFELYSVRQSFEDQRASQPQLESQLYDAQGRLAILLGTYPEAARQLLGDVRAATVNLDPIPVGLPSDLLQQRPDLIAAAQRMEASRLRVGVERANRFPSFSLTGSYGTQSAELVDLINLDQRAWSIAGNVVTPLFRAGALKASEEAAWSRYEQSVATYEKTVLIAFKEVETALRTYGNEQERYAFLQESLANAQASAQTQEDRYRRGVGDYLAFLDAQSNLVRVETAVTSAERALANARLTVHRSLGGAWTE